MLEYDPEKYLEVECTHVEVGVPVHAYIYLERNKRWQVHADPQHHQLSILVSEGRRYRIVGSPAYVKSGLRRKGMLLDE